MWPFGRRWPALERLPPEDTWSLGRGESHGRPLRVRINDSARAWAGHPALPIRLGVGVVLRAPDEDGLPEAAESGQLAAIEERIFAAIQAAGLGRVVLVITAGGEREFVAQVRDAGAAEAAVAEVRARTTTHELHVASEPDPRWRLFGRLAQVRDGVAD